MWTGSGAGRIVLGFALAVLVAGLAWLDFRTGPEVAFSLIYLLPVVAAGWLLGPAWGVVVGGAAAVGWLCCEAIWFSDRHLLIHAWNFVTRAAIFAGVGVLFANLNRDRRSLEQAHAREALLARTDALTGLLNARAFHERLAEEIVRARRRLRPVCVASLDLDGFKRVNDTRGHAAGDDLLRNVAHAIRGSVRKGDLAARIGGDEFAIYFDEADPAAVEKTARRMLEQLASATAEPLTGSVGIVVHPAPASAEELLRAADSLMYAAKAAGKNQVMLSTVTVNQGTPNR